MAGTFVAMKLSVSPLVAADSDFGGNDSRIGALPRVERIDIYYLSISSKRCRYDMTNFRRWDTFLRRRTAPEYRSRPWRKLYIWLILYFIFWGHEIFIG